MIQSSSKNIKIKYYNGLNIGLNIGYKMCLTWHGNCEDILPIVLAII